MRRSHSSTFRTMMGFMLAMLLLGPLAGAQEQAMDQSELPEQCFLFTSFRGDGDGLHLAWSTDGLNWNGLQNDRNFLRPQIGSKLMRDPCIIQGPDGLFHLVWTTGWYDKTIGHASSKDLINWSEQTPVGVMEHEPDARNSWAPEIAWDDAREQYMIFWATTIPGRFKEGEDAGDRAQGVVLNHRVYFTTTKDFKEFAPTKVLFNPGFSVIDSTIIKEGDTYYMVFKDETLVPPRKHLRVATATDMQGPYELMGESFTPEGVWVEGPSLFKIGDEFFCYFDMYRNGRYGAMKTKDFKTWENLTDQLKFNVRNVRHGTALKVSRDVLANLLKAPTTQP